MNVWHAVLILTCPRQIVSLLWSLLCLGSARILIILGSKDKNVVLSTGLTPQESLYCLLWRNLQLFRRFTTSRRHSLDGQRMART